MMPPPASPLCYLELFFLVVGLRSLVRAPGSNSAGLTESLGGCGVACDSGRGLARLAGLRCVAVPCTA